MTAPKLGVIAGGAAKDWRATGFGDRLLELMGRMAHVEKGGENKALGYKFLQEAEIKRLFNRNCRELGIVVAEVTMAPLSTSTPNAAVVRCSLKLVDAWVKEATPGLIAVMWEGVGGDIDKTGKAVMKAGTAAWKYAVTNGAIVSTGDDPEANEEAEAVTVERAIAATTTVSALNLVKPDVSALKGTRFFEELVVTFKAKMEALQGAGSEATMKEGA